MSFEIQHSASAISQRPNFTIANYSASADFENCSLGHCLLANQNFQTFLRPSDLIYILCLIFSAICKCFGFIPQSGSVKLPNDYKFQNNQQQHIAHSCKETNMLLRQNQISRKCTGPSEQRLHGGGGILRRTPLPLPLPK